MRLIDADELIRCMDKRYNEKKDIVPNNLAEGFAQMERLIKEQPTAYDVDKVVAQLEELKSQVPVNRILDDIIKDKPKELGQLIAYNKAIEIVKAGGIDRR